MKKPLLFSGSFAVLLLVLAVYGQTAAPKQQSSGPAQSVASAQRAILDQYCVTCHSEKAKAAGIDSARKLTLDNLDITRVAENAEPWERVVRKLRAGLMPPAGVRRPESATYNALVAWLENELDRNAVLHWPAPGLHRLNRTEYANAIRDLVALEIDPSKLLPSDDSTHGFDNMAGTLAMSPTLLEAYVSAAGRIARLAIPTEGDATPVQTVYRVPEDTSQDYHIEGLPFGTRGGMLIQHEFPADGAYIIRVVSS